MAIKDLGIVSNWSVRCQNATCDKFIPEIKNVNTFAPKAIKKYIAKFCSDCLILEQNRKNSHIHVIAKFRSDCLIS